MINLIHIASLLAKSNKPIEIKNKYFNISFAPKLTEAKLVRIIDFRGKLIHRLTILKVIYNVDNTVLTFL